MDPLDVIDHKTAVGVAGRDTAAQLVIRMRGRLFALREVAKPALGASELSSRIERFLNRHKNRAMLEMDS